MKRLIARDRNAVRGIFAAACAVVFLLVTVAHTFQHAAQAAPAVSLQIAASITDGSPDTADPAMAEVEHCHGCTILATEIEAQSELTVDARSIQPCATMHSFSPHARLVESPPPRPIA